MFGRKKKEDQPKTKVTRESFKDALKIFKYIRPYLGYFIAGMVFLVFSSLIFMVIPYLLGEQIDIAQGKSKMNITLVQAGLGLFAVLLIQGLFSYMRVICFANVSEKGIADIRKDLYKKMVSLPITFFEENKSGDLISRLTADVEKLYSTFSVTLAEFIRQLLTLIVGIVFLFVSTPRLALVMLATFPVIVVSGIFFGRYIRKFSKKRQEQLADSNSILGESIQSILVVKSFISEWFEIKRYRKSITKVVTISLKYAQARALFVVFIVTILFGSLFFIIYQGALMVQDGTMTAGDLVAFVSYTFIIGASIASLGNFGPEIIGAIGATERVREILGEKPELNLGSEESRTDFPVIGNISFNNVSFNYPTRKDIPVLKSVSLDIKAGQKVALVGPSGVGKSTIIQLLQQFYPIDEGDITLDGKSIYNHEIRDFRGHLALVPQEVILFGGTVRENILYGKENATDEEVIAAAKQSNSWEFIEGFPEGLDTLIGERGVKLSGGQRQRIAIARAILKDPKILLLDEATSALDSESEKLVQEALNNLMKGRTSIIIAHRLSTIIDVDKIFVLDNGSVIEEGTHKELMAIKDGHYLRQAQLAGL